MNVIKHQPPPPPPPPATYDLLGLTQSELDAILLVCAKCTTISHFLDRAAMGRAGLSTDLNRIYHAIQKGIYDAKT